MANVRITRSLSRSSAFGQQVLEQVAAVTARRLIQVAADAEKRTNDIVKDEFVNDRAPDRRRAGAHLLGSFRCRIIHNNNGFPIKLVMTSIAPGAKVNSLEGGAKPHVIPGPVVFPVAERWAKNKFGFGNVQPKANKFGAAYAKNAKGGKTVRAPAVRHPGVGAHHMMARGLEGAVQAAYHQAVVAQRGR